ncbi:MAG: ComEC/Rec2 family competence protein [Phycisphaeraceae bacterium]
MRGGTDETMLDDGLAPPEPVVAREAWPFVALALACITGITLGHWLPWGGLWLAAAGGALTGMATMLGRGRRPAALRWGLIATVALMAAWHLWQAQPVTPAPVARYVTERAQLAEVTGVIVDAPYEAERDSGAFARFDYRTSRTLTVLAVETIVVGEPRRVEPAAGRLLLHVGQSDHRLRRGQRIRAIGWLGAIQGPSNPGEFDYAQLMRDRGIVGRLTLPARDHWQRLAEPSPWHPATALHQVRQRLAGALLASLQLGMTEASESLALLETLLLGVWSKELSDTYDAFQRVGLAHVMSISGAHLAILLGLVWALARLVVPHPRWAAVVVLVVLGLYLLALPVRVPIMRAAIMAGVFGATYASGRRVPGLAMLAMAAVAVLVWRPGDLLTPGFQLSFGVVAGLMLFAGPVSQWLWPAALEPAAAAGGASTQASQAEPARLSVMLLRRAVDYAAANLVAFVIALPVVAYHFQIVSPLAMVMSLLALPAVVALLAVGYLKMVVGLALPSGSIVLAGPLTWLSETLLGLVDHAQRWPGAAVELTRSPSEAWVVATLAVAVAWLTGWYARRRAALTASVGVLLLWAVAVDGDWAGRWRQRHQPAAQVTVNMLAVGEGNCYLLRMPGYTALIDCGSQSYLDVGLRTVEPALRALGVRELDAIFLTHADLDHYSGVLDVLDQMPVTVVHVPPQLLDAARRQPGSATAYLVAGLHARQRPPRPLSRGWRHTAGAVELELLWPPAERTFERSNDQSFVFAIRAAGRTLILNGDIQDEAVQGLLAVEPDLRADVSEMPHHGSYADGSVAWLAATRPAVLLQSGSWRRLEQDRWPAKLRAIGLADAARLNTAVHGMVELRIMPDGTIDWTTFRDRPAGAE